MDGLGTAQTSHLADAKAARVELGLGRLRRSQNCRPVNITDSKTQPFHKSSPSPWQRSAEGGALPYEGARPCPGFSPG